MLGIYDKIQNPITKRWVNINGRIGKQVLKNYITVLYGGSKKIHTVPINDLNKNISMDTLDL